MNRQLLLVAVVFLAGFILGAVACEEAPQADADSRVSDFLKVGNYYYARGSDDSSYRFTVLQIVNDSWILADTGYEHIWFNVSQLMYVEVPGAQ